MCVGLFSGIKKFETELAQKFLQILEIQTQILVE